MAQSSKEIGGQWSRTQTLESKKAGNDVLEGEGNGNNFLPDSGDALIFELAVSTGYSPGAGLSSLLELEAGLSTLLSQKGLVFLPTGLEWFPGSGMSFLLIAYIIRLGVLMRALARLEDLDLRGPPQIH